MRVRARRGGGRRGPRALGVKDDYLYVGPTRQECGRGYRWGATMLWLAKGVTWFSHHCVALRVSSRGPPKAEGPTFPPHFFVGTTPTTCLVGVGTCMTQQG